MSAGRVGWLVAALAFAALWIARSVGPALDPGVVQDDARQHVFWMQRLVDTSLLRDDLFADYFESQAPPGYVLIYRALIVLVGDPLAASKLLPPVLGLAAASFTFLLVGRLHPSPRAAFLTAVLGSWYVWQYDDLPTGSPRAFLLPVLAALLWALAGRRRWLAVGLVAGAALVYPSAAALGVVMFGLWLVRLDRWPPSLATDRRDWLAFGLAAVVAGAILAPVALGGSAFGPTVSAATARTLPEFGPNGRTAYFLPDPYQFWVASYRSGFDLRVADARLPDVPIFFELLALALALPVAAGLGRTLATPRRDALTPRRPGKALTPRPPLPCAGEGEPGRALGSSESGPRLWERGAGVGTAELGATGLGAAAGAVGRILAASLALFAAAHLLLFALYLPARFVAWTVPLALAVAAGVGLARLIEQLSQAVAARLAPRQAAFFASGLASGLAVVLALGLAAYPARYDGNFVPDRLPTITAYLREQSPDILVAGVPTEADSVPAFAGRRVLTNREYALAYHQGFSAEVDRRTRDLIDAYYADSSSRVIEVAARYGIDIFLVNEAAYDPESAVDAWAGSFAPYTDLVVGRASRSRRFALLDAVRRCGVLTEGRVTVVWTGCLAASR